PSAYNLLPSSKYFDPSSPDYLYYLYDLGDVDGDEVTGRLSYDTTKAFLKNTGRNDILIQNAQSLHNDLDDFNPRDFGVQSFNIVGCGTPTIGKIFANNKKSDEDFHYQIKYISGDGTVPERSAEGMNADKLFYATGVEHATMPSQSGIKDLVASILSNGTENFDYDTNSNIKTNSDSCALPNGKIISIHSPVALNIYDDAGHHTGPDVNGDIEYGIEGVTYDTLDGNKFAFIPDSIKYTIKFNATDIGAAGVDVQDYRNGAIVRSESFDRIPIDTLNTRGEVVIENTGSKILLDRNGNGQVETLTPTLQVDGDLPEEIMETSAMPAIISDSVTISSGGQMATTSLNIQTFKYLNNTPLKIKLVSNDKVKTKKKDGEAVTSTTGSEEVKLKDERNSELASPAGFFNNIVSVVWNFISRLFNKIINLFR
ncbi:MAG: Lecithin:cholesterol acyltransferase, partial [Candidatus Taylorbacteria bacterium]|nr:Lecithin:cholesterol acyltransferase [Candidatus Taylorbacteria bacterium]